MLWACESVGPLVLGRSDSDGALLMVIGALVGMALSVWGLVDGPVEGSEKGFGSKTVGFSAGASGGPGTFWKVGLPTGVAVGAFGDASLDGTSELSFVGSSVGAADGPLDNRETCCDPVDST